MSHYGKGDIVLLSCSKLGIMTSSSTVREIRGDITETSRIIKKLTAKDLAESLADLMERYNNLESKSIASKECSHCTTKSTSTSTAEPMPKLLQIPKTPNYANHIISPTNSIRQFTGNHILKSKLERSSSSTNDTTTTSTISSLSPEQIVERIKSPKIQNRKKKLFSHKFSFKSHKNKNQKNKVNKLQNDKIKMTKRSVSNNDSHYLDHAHGHSQQNHHHHQNGGYHHQYFHHYHQHNLPPYYDANISLPFSHIRSNPDHQRSTNNETFLDAPKQNNRFTRSKSTETPPFAPSTSHNPMINHFPHNPYFIAYTPSTITPPIPSPIAYHHQNENNAPLLDVLLSAPSSSLNIDSAQQQKKRSHPYKKRAINGNKQKGKKHSVASILTSRTNLTSSPSHSGHSSNVPTYPQQYVPNKKAMIDPIIEYSYSRTNSYTNSPKQPQQKTQQQRGSSYDSSRNHHYKRKYHASGSSKYHHHNSHHAHGHHHNHGHGHHHYAQKKSNTKSLSIFSEIEGKNENKTKIFYHPHPSAKKNKKLKLSHNNAYSQPQPLHHGHYYGNNNKAANNNGGSNGSNYYNAHWKHSKTMGHVSNMDLNISDILSITNTNNGGTAGMMLEQSMTTKSNTNTMIYHEGSKSHSYSVHNAQSVDDMMTPLTLSPAPIRNKHRRQKRSQSVVEFFDPAQPSNLSDLYNNNNNNHKKQSESKKMIKKEKKYKIVLRKENSNKAYYIQDSLPDNNNNQSSNNINNKPRLSESKGSTAQSALSINSLTPTISQTPSYLRDDQRWQKSMSHKLSMTAASSDCTDDDDNWMLHKHININGNVEESSTKRRFFGDDEEFPNIVSPHDHDHIQPANNRNRRESTPNSNSSDLMNVSDSSSLIIGGF